MLKLQICVDCGNLREHAGRGLCVSCHSRRKRKGTLYKFPLKLVKRGTVGDSLGDWLALKDPGNDSELRRPTLELAVRQFNKEWGTEHDPVISVDNYLMEVK